MCLFCEVMGYDKSGICGSCATASQFGPHNSHERHGYRPDAKYNGFEYCGQRGCCFPLDGGRGRDTEGQDFDRLTFAHFNQYQQYMHLNPQKREIRLMQFQPWETKEAPITCNLKVFQYPWPQYQALSYCWGDAEDTKAIGLCQAVSRENSKTTISPFVVTKNLYQALHFLRRQQVVQYIWVDALCINQRDVDERKSQVRMMEDIYAKAKEVCVFLDDYGEPEYPCQPSIGLEFAELITQYGDERYPDGLDRFSPSSEQMRELANPSRKWLLDPGGLNFDLDPATLQQVLYINLFRHDWFRRIWVLQEVIRATGPVLFGPVRREVGDVVVP